ncbi:hypothetical protein [Amnibacterium kyonggiense]|uniref:Uncharacterized protein n=1 Tax=Amnibacterium kyonggiense TaxID=595671 RepID=A0A4R7FEK8_9MICO|nr:hypothetical protein [Amnibacterium kyonggiense]TDS75803.1 hypothetical protein CLV52_2912 [Amnibacterium kyonggiense]
MVHTDLAFVVLTVTGLAALVIGIRVTASGPPPMNVELYAVFAISCGATAVIAGGIGAPLIIGIARRDRAALALVNAHRPRALALPGAVSNHALLRSLRAQNPSAITPRSVVWAVDERGMELWQPGYSAPTLIVPWSTVVATSTAEMPQGRAVIAVAVFQLSDGHDLRLAFRNRFGGITLMSRGRLEDVLDDFTDLSDRVENGRN